MSILCLDKHSPKGSCHLDESSMNHTLAQKHLCEFWCGMHLTCKNTPVKPDRRNWMTRSERLCEENLSMSFLKESVVLYKQWKIRLRKPCIQGNWKQAVWTRHGGSRVIHVPLLKFEITKQVHQGDQPRLPPSCIASLACVRMMAACPLLNNSLFWKIRNSELTTG